MKFLSVKITYRLETTIVEVNIFLSVKITSTSSLK